MIKRHPVADRPIARERESQDASTSAAGEVSDLRGRTDPAGPARGEITGLLAELGRGNEECRETVFERVYDELRVLAHARLRSERGDITLSTTGLVHEAYLRLAPLEGMNWQDRSHFFATAARAMRRILIDRARALRRLKRGGGGRPVALENAQNGEPAEPAVLDADELLALDEALDRLATLSPRQLRVVELRFFAGLSFGEIADALDVSVNTVKRDWSTARVWLNCELA